MAIIIGVSLYIQFNTIDLHGIFIQPNNICFGTTVLPVDVLLFACVIVCHTAQHSVTCCCTTIIQIGSYGICVIGRRDFLNKLLTVYTLDIIECPVDTISYSDIWTK